MSGETNWHEAIKARCPQCGHEQKPLRLHVETCELECPECHARFSPLEVFNDREVQSRFQRLPLETQRALLNSLGFEKRPAPQTRKPFLYAIAGFYVFIVLIGTADCIRTGQGVLYCTMAILGIPALCLVLYAHCKGGARSYYWRRREQT